MRRVLQITWELARWASVDLGQAARVHARM